jgi:hypothetical protein
MTIKVKLRGNKAIVRFNNQMDESYFVHVIRTARDNGQPHPKISLKSAKGEQIPPRKQEKPLPKEQPVVVAKPERGCGFVD